MIHSPELADLAAALSAAQGEFEAVSKDSTNPFYKSSYSSLPTVVKAATPILCANGLSVTQTLGHDEQGDTLTTMVLHKSGQWIADTMQLRPIKDDPQAQGSATTYGRRYAYMAALGLVADDDDDGAAASAGTRKPAARKPVAKPSGGAEKATAAKPAKTEGKPDSPDPSPAVASGHIETINAQFKKSGKSLDDLELALVSVGADTAPIKAAEDGDAEGLGVRKRAAFRAVIAGLNLDQAVTVLEFLGGSAQDLS